MSLNWGLRIKAQHCNNLQYQCPTPWAAVMEEVLRSCAVAMIKCKNTCQWVKSLHKIIILEIYKNVRISYITFHHSRFMQIFEWDVLIFWSSMWIFQNQKDELIEFYIVANLHLMIKFCLMAFHPIPISCSSSTSLCHGYQRHGHLGAASVAGAQRQRRHPGILPVLQWDWQTRMEHCQQQACYQNQVMGTDIKTCLVTFLQVR